MKTENKFTNKHEPEKGEVYCVTLSADGRTKALVGVPPEHGADPEEGIALYEIDITRSEAMEIITAFEKTAKNKEVENNGKI